MRTLRGCACLLALMFAGCASTSVTNAWKNPAIDPARPALRKVLVVALVPSEATRHQLEQELATNLAERGLQAVTSYQVLPEGTKITRDTIKKAVEGENFDAILVSRFASLTTRVDPANYSYYSYFNAYGPLTYGSGYGTYEVANVETSLFDTRGGSLIWSANTQTVDAKSPNRRVPGLADVIVKRLTKDDVII